jgi:hypothetical protein
VSNFARAKPPLEVVAACGAIAGSSVIASIMTLVPAQANGSINVVVIGALTVLMIFGLLKRQNWLRWLLVLLYAVGTALMLIVIAKGGFLFLRPLLRLHAAIQSVTAVLLLLPRSNQWFRRSAHA